MGIAISALHGMFTPVAGLLAWLAGEDSRRLPALRASVSPRATMTPRTGAEPSARPACVRQPRSAGTGQATLRRPLRVLRVAEPGSAASGRLVISGRMADVCAELDRLAALEASRH